MQSTLKSQIIENQAISHFYVGEDDYNSKFRYNKCLKYQKSDEYFYK